MVNLNNPIVMQALMLPAESEEYKHTLGRVCTMTPDALIARIKKSRRIKGLYTIKILVEDELYLDRLDEFLEAYWETHP